MDIANNILSFLSIVQFSWFLLGVIFAFTLYFIFFYRKERRLFKNINRPVAIIASSEDSMDHEAKLLQRVEFFNIDHLQDPTRSIDFIDDHHRLVILRYYQGDDNFWRTYSFLTGKHIPVIVFSKPGEIIPQDIGRIQSYSLHTLCNTPLRLISDVFTIMSTYPEGK